MCAVKRKRRNNRMRMREITLHTVERGTSENVFKGTYRVYAPVLVLLMLFFVDFVRMHKILVFSVRPLPCTVPVRLFLCISLSLFFFLFLSVSL